jgi:hypothetical protein
VSAQYVRPKWWQLYLALPILIALFTLENRIKVSVRGHQALQIGILLLVYGFVHLWLKANETALSDPGQFRGTVTVINILPHGLAGPKSDRQLRLRLPDHEVKGTLSDTYETDYIDAEFFPVEEIPQEVKKE